MDGWIRQDVQTPLLREVLTTRPSYRKRPIFKAKPLWLIAGENVT